MAIVPHGAGGSLVSMPMSMLTPDNYTVVVPTGDAVVDGKKCKKARAMLLGTPAEDILLQVSTKLIAREVWDSLKVCFVGADRVWAARLATLHGDFDRLRMADGEALDVYAGRLGAVTARYGSLGAMLGDATLVKKLLDIVPGRLYPAVAGIEQFCNIDEMAIDEALGRLRAFDERTRRHGQDGGEHWSDQLLLTAAQWAVRERQQGGARDDDGGRSMASGNDGNWRDRCYNCGQRGHFWHNYTHQRKAAVVEERVLLADISVEDGGLL
ncbi:uncharacterized protein [Aegilops tauschii subsp. strangulata]|uniref:uncharacterized protein n=1 Tax=Aegilops tauschii subsp. strangulata TaxID=200361 RepID=UPI003CC8C807